MGRAKLPEARVEPRGVGGHLARLRAHAREKSRAAARAGALIARVVGWSAFAAGTVAFLVWIAPPPRSANLDDIRRIQADFQRSQRNMIEAQRALEQLNRVDLNNLNLNTYQLTQPMPVYGADVYRPTPSYDRGHPGQIDWSSMPDLASPTPAGASATSRDVKAERAADRVRAAEAKRAQRTH